MAKPAFLKITVQAVITDREGSTIFEDLGDYMISLRKLLRLDCKIICPGHGPLITDPRAKIEEYIDRREKRDEQILSYLRENSKKPM
ncbi:hypothetical protein TELCIR_00278 [Teladorsagia circumcincta]|uniref:Metallo-beta-lactamase domain-containing protein n=1 Tax=Teladorsagia circumcincta TaxID=45464 RepID=A0A2G9V547_TELCI|nr:hypothetical protein TELCIR_00278 [Teladorsagia circumcincta]